MLMFRLLEVVESVSDASLLMGVGFKLRHPELYETSIKTYGSWEATLARLVVFVRDKDKLEAQDRSQHISEDTVEKVHRERDPAAEHPTWGFTTKGELLSLKAEDLPLKPSPEMFVLPELFGQLCDVTYEGSFADVTVFTRQGQYFGLMKDLVPRVAAIERAHLLHESLDMQANDGPAAVIATHRLRQREDRLIHVTARGKAKATQVREYTPVIGRNGRDAFLLNDGDKPIAVLVGEEFNGLFCASAMGQGIHMSAQDLRSMGRKSVGVNVMKLAGEDDRVVSAFLTDSVREIAVVTADGYGKRISFREFRKQGRGGAGMQVLRLNPNDHVVGVAPCTEMSDLLLITNTGRIWRIPSSTFAIMGRPARGKRVFELDDHEHICSMTVLPCGGNVLDL